MKNKFSIRVLFFFMATPYQVFAGVMAIFWNLYFVITGDTRLHSFAREVDQGVDDAINYAIKGKRHKVVKEEAKEILDRMIEGNKTGE